MLIARAMLAKIRPPPLNPREIQNQVDISRAAGLTAAYAAQQQQDEESSCSFDQLEKEIAALKPLERKRRAQTAINDQVSLEPISAAVVKPTVTPTYVSPRDPHAVGTVLSDALPLIGGPGCCFHLLWRWKLLKFSRAKDITYMAQPGSATTKDRATMACVLLFATQPSSAVQAYPVDPCDLTKFQESFGGVWHYLSNVCADKHIHMQANQ